MTSEGLPGTQGIPKTQALCQNCKSQTNQDKLVTLAGGQDCVPNPAKEKEKSLGIGGGGDKQAGINEAYVA